MALTKVTNRMINNAVINVIDYGADNTGSSDSSVAIQAAIDAAPTQSIVLLPAGTYKLESGITINKSLTLMGDRATITTDAGYTIGIEVTAREVQIRDLTFNKVDQTDRFNIVLLVNESFCVVENCEFIGNGETVGEYGRGVGLQFGKGTTTPNNLKVINCTFKNYEYCLKTATSKNLIVSNCYFTGGIDPTYAAANYGTSSMGDGIKMSLDLNDDDQASGTTYTGLIGASITDCVFEDMNRDGIDMYYRGSNVNVSGCIFRGSVNKALDIKVIYTSTDTSIPDTRQTRCVSVTNNQFINLVPTNYAIEVITTTDGTITIDENNSSQAVVIDANVFENIQAPILNIYNSSFISFTNNIVRKYDSPQNEEYVIVFAGTDAKMRQFNFSGNQVRIFDDGIDVGFIYSANSVQIIEHLNVCNNTYYGGEDDSFIILRNLGLNNFVISNNTIQGNLDTAGSFGGVGIILSDASIGIISNNLIEYANTNGIRLNGAYNVRMQNNIIGNCGQTSAEKEIRLEDGTSITTTDRIYIQYNTLHDNGSTTEGVQNNASGGNITIANNDTF